MTTRPTRDDFVKRFRYVLAGFGLYGVAADVHSENIGGGIARASRVFDLPAEVEKMLDQMWKFCNPPEAPPVTRTDVEAAAAQVRGDAPRPTVNRTPPNGVKA